MNRFSLPGMFLVSALIMSGAMAGDSDKQTLPEHENFQLFLLAGQSNMAGRGDLAEADPDVNPRVLMLAKDGTWKVAMDPVHFDKKIAGVGLARSFAAELLKHDPGITIGLVPTAIGGSPIATWGPGAYHDRTDTHPYDDAISRAKRAMQDGKLKGILWHQGEGDSGEKKSAVYKEKLVELVARFRADLDAPEVPFIIGQLGQFEAKPWSPGRHVVNQAHIEVAKEVPFCGFVSSAGLSDKGDNTHFSSESLKEFGRRYADVYLKVVSNKD